jgi:hypothetical protein
LSQALIEETASAEVMVLFGVELVAP